MMRRRDPRERDAGRERVGQEGEGQMVGKRGGGGVVRICCRVWCWSGAEEEEALGGDLFFRTFFFSVSLIW
jgi:hypothetical protein